MNQTPDEALEQRIQTAAVRCALARTHEDHAPAWKDLVELIRQRSPQQVAKMERERRIG